ncbi:type II citrate synthase [Methyloprofundus sedimenti]|uniref:Citrate synthase n=1 Tax=Methyloprofundus sedimenti TaxID=1420851 RepID=A0A1V8M666_9GAMM|nr:citrate synthase [Methyloprofundus sedimenti]OQK17064.1 type II citrate synthase [Methyloprofundus sedimenti]
MSDNATLEIQGKRYSLPLIVGSEQEMALDISRLRAESACITLDNGFGNTGSCESAITFLNGEKGILHYRGYPIEQLAEKSVFQEVAYLLYYGELPSQSELNLFKQKVASYSSLPQGIYNIIDQFPLEAHPMGVVSAAVSALSAFYPEFINPTSLSQADIDRAIAQLMGQIKIIIAYFFRRTQSQAPVPSDPSLIYAADFLNMLQGGEGNPIDPEVADALDTLLILHADHEQNCSTSTVRVIGSSKANIFATVSGGIDALWGQLHGGANQAVLEMLNEIQNNGGDYQKYLHKAKDKNDPFRLMGFGHRVYKNFDPRAKIIKNACDSVLQKLGIHDPLLDIARGLEEQALKDPYFIERHLYPNVDFYSGIIYQALGIPANMFTTMFAMGRMPGWLSQWKEMRASEATRIARPRQVYIGATARDYVAINQR